MTNLDKSPADVLSSIFSNLSEHFGEQHWWPAETSFEVLVGAILTQQTSWRNVEKAIASLKLQNLMTPQAIASIRESKLQELVKPAGFFRQKAQRLQHLCKYLANQYNGDLPRFFDKPIESLKRELLALEGVGPETADSMILYGAEKPTFVIDAYTIRFLKRFGLIEVGKYETVKNFLESYIPLDLNRYKEYHALIVELCKTYCKSRPRCGECPLKGDCVRGKKEIYHA
ncbi:MAG: endonuclease III domain-containing protein [Candidatus Bathyarchaeia archaeon]